MNSYYSNLLKTITDADERALLAALMPHVGSDRRAERVWLVCQVYSEFTPNTDRKFRALVAQMQNAGVLILSDSTDGGFWLAGDLEEVKRFVASEIDSRIAKLGEKKSKLLAHARATFGGQMDIEQGFYW